MSVARWKSACIFLDFPWLFLFWNIPNSVVSHDVKCEAEIHFELFQLAPMSHQTFVSIFCVVLRDTTIFSFNAAKYCSTRKRAQHSRRSFLLVLAEEKKVIYYSHRQLEDFYFYLTILWRHRIFFSFSCMFSTPKPFPPSLLHSTTLSEAFCCLKRFVWWKKES